MNPPSFNSQSYSENYSLGATVSSVMKRVYFKMFIGLLVTAFVSLWASQGAFIEYLVYNRWLMFVLIFAELGIVLGLSAGINKLSATTAAVLFYVYAAINGLMLSSIFLVYTATSIAKTFFITAGTFGVMSVYGYFTNKDLTKFGTYLIMALFGLIICSLVNIFLKSSGFEWIISGLGVLIFIGLTAWDTQKIKEMALMSPESSHGRLATLGALSLYLDFINLFLYLLRFFGNNRD